MTGSIDFSRSKLSVFASYIRPHSGDFALDMGLSLAVALIDLAFPYVTRQAMNRLLPQGLFSVFFAVMAVLLASYLLRAGFQYLITIVGHRMGTLVEADMRRDVFMHMQSLSFSFFDKNRTGVLMARVTSDLFEIVELAHHGPENILTCGVTLLGAPEFLSRPGEWCLLEARPGSYCPAPGLRDLLHPPATQHAGGQQGCKSQNR